MSRGPAYVAGGKLIRNRQLIRCQDRTIKHAWERIRSNGNRSFLIADAVGRGKSYMALGVAMGFWRLAGKTTFRIVIIAPTQELSSAWMKKLADGHETSPFSDVVRIVEGRSRGHQDYFAAYVKEFRKQRALAAIFSVRTRREARRLQHALKSQELSSRFKQTRGARRIEVLITSPRFLTKTTESLQWRRWAGSADLVIADEAYGMRNDLTAYGRLMRPMRKKRGVFRRCPWLIALSATLLSKDMRDTLGVLSALLEWGSRRNVLTRLEKVRAACSRYNQALNKALASSNRRSVGYTAASNTLARLLRRYMSRMPAVKNRSYETWLTHQNSYDAPAGRSVRNFPFPKADIDYDGVSRSLDNETLQADLAHFLRAISRNGHLANTKTRQSYLRLTEIDASNPGAWPKPDALKKWMSEHIQALWKYNRDEPSFKVVVYCHHVSTARTLALQGKDSLSDSVKKAVRKAWQNLASRESALFSGFYTKRKPVLEEALRKAGLGAAFLDKLPRRNATLLVSALLNARRETSARRKAAALVRTLKAARQPEKDSPVLGLLQRNIEVRVAILEALACKRLARWSSSLSVADKKERALAWFVFNNLRVRGILESVQVNADVEEMARKIGPLKAVDAKTLAELVVNALSEDRRVRALLRRWNRKMSVLRQAKDHEDLDRSVGHRTKLVEVLTGDNPDRRVAVSQDFLTAGNPFLLILTNVCAMGVDLHHYCWDVIHYSPSWTPSEFEQKSGRIDRPRPRVLRRALNIGEERRSSAIRIHHLIWPFTYDERVLRRMNIRGHLSERLLSSRRMSDPDDKTAELFKRLPPLSLSPK
ncbi:MAG: DEAD/DEAH box helicase [Nitrospira sp. BO4]|jgi:hypothetical protein|nr:DEAD/DEAH box helicase [Nitrospira sp. BO4]